MMWKTATCRVGNVCMRFIRRIVTEGGFNILTRVQRINDKKKTVVCRELLRQIRGASNMTLTRFNNREM